MVQSGCQPSGAYAQPVHRWSMWCPNKSVSRRTGVRSLQYLYMSCFVLTLEIVSLARQLWLRSIAGNGRGPCRMCCLSRLHAQTQECQSWLSVMGKNCPATEKSYIVGHIIWWEWTSGSLVSSTGLPWNSIVYSYYSHMQMHCWMSSVRTIGFSKTRPCLSGSFCLKYSTGC